MAKKDKTTPDFMGSIKPVDTSKSDTQRFDEGLERNTQDYHLKEGQWTYARNAITNSNIGDIGRIGNEPGNLLCITVPNGYTIIGAIHIEADKYAIYSTNNTGSEIGYFEEDTCKYTTIVNDNCLNFKTTNLVYGVARETSECNHVLYWDDGLNPSRVLNIGDIRTAPYPAPWPNVPWKCVDVLAGPCVDCEPIGPPYILDCDKIRLAPLMDPLCLRVEKGTVGGNLLNGSYFVVGAYTVKGERMTDYFPPSNIQPIFNHQGSGGSVEIYVDNADNSYFDEFELVVVSVIQQQTVAKKVGIYSTRTKQITLDIIDQSLASVPLEFVPIRSQINDKSDAMYMANDVLLRVGPTSKLDFNYQPLANQIRTKWQSVEYDADYYIKGGNKTGYMRDEVYSFFIRFIYDTGDRSASYHIPGRPSFNTPFTLNGLPANLLETATAPVNNDHYETSIPLLQGCPAKVWEVYNTATTNAAALNPPIIVDDNDDCPGTGPGKVIQEGYMGYWESTETYPDNKPEVWNSNLTTGATPYPSTGLSQYDLCGQPIRHHRFPDNDFSRNSTMFDTRAGYLNNTQKIRIMGVKFENILPPRIDPHDPNSPLVPGIKCFEILRGSRKGNRTVIAKGIINNMVEYDIPDEVTNKDGLFQNYPYNDLRGDEFLSTNRTRWKGFTGTYGYYSQSTGNPVQGAPGSRDYDATHYSQHYFSFHSPETNFSNPFLGTRELKVYQEFDGKAQMRYQYASEHPKHKIMTDLAWLMSAIAGLGIAAYAVQGKIIREYPAPTGTLPRGGLSIFPSWENFGLNILAGYLGFGAESLRALLGGTWPITGVQSGVIMENTAATSISPIFQALFAAFTGGAPTFTYYWMEGAEATYNLIMKCVPYNQHALQQMSHCFYDNSVGAQYGTSQGVNPRAVTQRRRYISEITYVDNQIQDFDINKRINNLYRSRFVALNVSTNLNPPSMVDYTRYDTSLRVLTTSVGSRMNPPMQVGPNPGTPNGLASPPGTSALEKTYLYKNPNTAFERFSSTYYAAIKQRLKNQYGQLNNISQIPITTCPNCCIGQNGGQQLVVNPYFNSGLSGWTANNWSISTTQGLPPNGAQTAGTNVANSLSQPINWVPGEQYTFCFDIVSLDSVYKIGVSFNSNSPNSYYATYSAAGNYCITVTALANWDEIRFTQFAVGGCFNTWPVPQTSWTTIPMPNPANPTDPLTLRPNVTYGWSGGSLSEYIDLRMTLPGPSGSQSIGLAPGSTAGPIILHPGGSTDKGNVTNRRTRGQLGGCGNVGLSPEQITYGNITSGYFEGNGTYCLKIYWEVDVQAENPCCDFGTCGPCTNCEYPFFSIGLAVFKNTPNSRAGFSTNGSVMLTLAGTGCQPLGITPNANASGSYLSYNDVTYYRAYTTGCGGSTFLGVNSGSCVISSLVLQPGWKAIPYIYLQSLNAGVRFSITPIEYKKTVLDNVTITRQGCDGSSIGPLFGGDVYINRYTEKNTFFYFYDWLYKQPDGSYFDYTKYNMVPYPTYWVNTDQFDIGEGVLSLSNLINPLSYVTAAGLAITSLLGSIGGIGSWAVQAAAALLAGQPVPAFPGVNIDTSGFTGLINGIKSPSDYHVLDRPALTNWAWQEAIVQNAGTLQLGSNILSAVAGYDIGFTVKYGYFYLFNSGVRDFYVESEYNVALRDWDDEASRRHYDYKTYTSLPDLFNTEIIKAGNYYKYDPSLSISKNWYSYVNWGNMQQRSYDPTLANTCFTYRPDRIIYSLQQQYESVKDNWRLFLANNYKDFLSRVNSVKQINKSGVLVLLQSDSPLMFQGLDQLQTDLGTKLTIGDGGLFSQPQQTVNNAERAFEYASCQNRLSVINTPAGTFWINQNQGKIFQMSSSIKEISMGGLKWWLAKYLPYNLTAFFPNYAFTDNPIAGIGCQTIYDNQNNIVYFTKKDYKPKLNEEGKPLVNYDPVEKKFYIPGFSTSVLLTNTSYFEDASWTLSFDLKSNEWVSYHDWHPDLTIASKNTFMTTKGGGVWIHNKRCDKYVNYYGVDYPFEIEYTMNTIQTVNTLRSIEYQLEVYRYNQQNCYDRFHVLDFNFDTAVVYNTEQCSGTLKLNLTPKNNAPAIIGYPFYNTATVANEILYSKEENKYRFNQFYDITRDRGEFDFVLYPDTNAVTGPIEANASSVSPLNASGAVPGGQQAGSYATQPIWATGPEGYKKNLNTANLNYIKSQLQRKKFRHYTSSVLLRRTVSGDKKMLVAFTNNKNLLSSR